MLSEFDIDELKSLFAAPSIGHFASKILVAPDAKFFNRKVIFVMRNIRKVFFW